MWESAPLHVSMLPGALRILVAPSGSWDRFVQGEGGPACCCELEGYLVCMADTVVMCSELLAPGWQGYLVCMADTVVMCSELLAPGWHLVGGTPRYRDLGTRLCGGTC